MYPVTVRDKDLAVLHTPQYDIDINNNNIYNNDNI